MNKFATKNFVLTSLIVSICGLLMTGSLYAAKLTVELSKHEYIPYEPLLLSLELLNDSNKNFHVAEEYYKTLKMQLMVNNGKCPTKPRLRGA